MNLNTKPALSVNIIATCLLALTVLVSCGKKPQIKPDKPGKTDTTTHVDPPATLTAQVSTLTGANVSFTPPFKAITNIVIDKAGNAYVSDFITNTIDKITPDGTVSVFAGGGDLYKPDGTGTKASFLNPAGMAFDSKGNLIVADRNNYTIRKITPDGVVTTIAGQQLVHGQADGPAAQATFYFPYYVAVDVADNIYITDNNRLIRKLSNKGIVSTIAGGDSEGYADGVGTKALFNYPLGIVLDPAGNIFVADAGNGRVRKITPSGTVTTFAGGKTGSKNGVGSAAELTGACGITIDKANNLFVATGWYNQIRKITPAAVVTTVAGTGQKGTDNGPGAVATFAYAMDLAFDQSGTLYVVDADGYDVRKVTPAGITSTFTGNSPVPVNGLPGVATFYKPTGVVIGADGYIYVADAGNNIIRKVSADGVVSTYAGSGAAALRDGTLAAAAFNNPTGIAADQAGNLFVADSANNVIRTISNSGSVGSITLFVSSNGASGPLNYPVGVAVDAKGSVFYSNTAYNTICKIAGTDISTFSVGNNPGVTNGMFFYKPFGVAADVKGNIYVADAGNHRICKLNADGLETTLAGVATAGNSPVAGTADGTGITAYFNNPKGLAADTAGNIYVADTRNNKIRKITPKGVVTTIAGTGAAGINNGTGSNATFNSPSGIAVNASGTIIYVADTGNNLIRKITFK
ncbi:NHL domain-containing protein [Mucilaginibacter xinganensis]|uniref:Teneurin NHL domain-containing protein n=1 Tax=Mucilaginibacter xinganensis TaxID=1234841 RepID=A0A223P0Z6_9SPHI|nr:SMP-30/gluconolactonase/LRE family protein [Mucilaginibacter xinganensis]ASU35803.1 hypothetical protein MuYL_3918 [Mucilaginibacter xinganensis]